MRVLMLPHLSDIGSHGVGGINQVVTAYFDALPKCGIELVDKAATSYDILASHAGAAASMDEWPNAVHTHGLYWANEYPLARTHYDINATIIDEIRHAKGVSVPSRWVAKSFQRDMRFTPAIIPHGIYWDEWQTPHDNRGYVLWNKNRPSDACNPVAVGELALMHPDQTFLTTYAPDYHFDNIIETGPMPHPQMKRLVQEAAVYLSTPRETFGIGVLEALASGVPVLGWNIGGNRDLVEHGVTGYLAEPGDYEDLSSGLLYCLDHRQVLSANARDLSRQWTWDNTAQIVHAFYTRILQPEPATVSIIIPSYNYGEVVGRAIESAVNQDYPLLTDIIVVDDGSPDDGLTARTVLEWAERDHRVQYIHQANAGVAAARNKGIAATTSTFIVCLDADDAIEPQFISHLLPVLESDRSYGIAYSSLRWVTPTGYSRTGDWPGEYNYNEQLIGNNQVPTCCLFRREMWERLGGYRSRYSPTGAGTEDAEFWLRAGSIGYNAIKATNEPLFIYTMGTGHTFQSTYTAPEWLSMHPWTTDSFHPFASLATPQYRSHPAFQYDSPDVSIIIPIGPGHETDCIDAIDSVLAQDHRNWELVIVDDTNHPTDCANCDSHWLDGLRAAYPFAKFFVTPGAMGAGYARNRGVELATAPFLLFLDADDILKSTAVADMLAAWNETESIIYTDYEAHADGVTVEYAQELYRNKRLLNYDENTGYAVWNGNSAEYDYRLAQKQPGPDSYYIWSLISSLIPTAWHYEVNGFDETMQSWEDWDYWIRLAKLGKPFSRLAKPLVVYLYFTGSRRITGEQLAPELINYLIDKYQGVTNMPCTSCGSKRPTVRTTSPAASLYRNPAPPSQSPTATYSARVSEARAITDGEFIKCKYNHPNRGEHRFIGPAAFDFELKLPGDPRVMQMAKNADGTYSINYGYICGGTIILAHRADVQLSQYLIPVEEMVTEQAVANVPRVEREVTAPKLVTKTDAMRDEIAKLREEIAKVEPALVDPAPATPIDPSSDPELASRTLDTGRKTIYNSEVTMTQPDELPLDLLPIPPAVRKTLVDNGVTTIGDVTGWTEADWMAYKGIGEAKAEAIVRSVAEMLSD